MAVWITADSVLTEVKRAKGMMVTVETEYCGQHVYRVAVRVDGRVEESFPATVLTVAKIRNRACERWAEVADRVESNEITRYGI